MELKNSANVYWIHCNSPGPTKWSNVWPPGVTHGCNWSHEFGKLILLILWAGHELQIPISVPGAEFLGIIGQNPCVSKSNRWHCVVLFWFSLLIEIYSIDSSNKVHNYPEVLNFNQLFLKLNQIIICNYTKYDIQCHQFSLSCSILIVNRNIVSPMLNVGPQHYLSFLVIFWGDYRFILLQLLSLTMCFLIQIPIIHDNISSQVVGKRR
jgi:hypothetical protein